ncbi:DUF397 domain-containing protein [Kitasatospora sp. NPDC094019]|uniref:DUF397 domain-containing protein n=1 Tax=Kitasatospora sp. NPDC094019 TaxID=3364091 RepID=UPI0037F4903C
MTPVSWRKSSHSQNGGNCIEVADGYTDRIPVRDSKDPQGPSLLFPSGAWRSFVAAVQAGEFDTP